jgi:hypothetical protein
MDLQTNKGIGYAYIRHKHTTSDHSKKEEESARLTGPLFLHCGKRNAQKLAG